MPSPCAVYTRQEVFEALQSISKRDRELILTFMRSLAQNLFQEGDYADEDETGRPNQIRIVGRYAVTFWADHAAREMRVTNLLNADAP